MTKNFTLRKKMNKIIMLAIIGSFVYGETVPKGYPEGELGKTVKLGEDIINNTNTHPLTKDLVENQLKCVSCHLAGADGHPGSAKSIGSFVGIAARFPLYKAREGVVETLQDRIDNCFMRSMDGIRPIIDTEASIAMLTYVTWLSSGTAIDLNPQTNHASDFANTVKRFTAIQQKATAKNYQNGQKIFKTKCADCHGDKGQGVAIFPPLWGKNTKGKWLAYNAGAGMSKLDKSAAWIQSNMPKGAGDTLSDQESADVALYINAQERADFDLAKKLSDEKNMGYYNSKVLKEKDSVKSNFKHLGLDLDMITKE